MNKLITGLFLLALSVTASAADDTRSTEGSGTPSAKTRADRQTTTSDASDKRKHPDAKVRSTMDKARPASGHSGSAVGETGGPAATEGHTGSTTNKSNSPGK